MRVYFLLFLLFESSLDSNKHHVIFASQVLCKVKLNQCTFYVMDAKQLDCAFEKSGAHNIFNTALVL